VTSSPSVRPSVRAAERGGFTLVEMMVVVAVVSILARIALPNLQEAAIRARAVAALGDVDVIRTAAANYHARTNDWPAEAAAGVVPPELVADLPDGFTFTRGEYHLDWERWSLPEGIPGSNAQVLLGVSIATDDELLGNAVASLVGRNGWYSLGHSNTFLIDGT
jgi:prepilin-type N-terminal cleavage/methylation domain-containing protein